MGETQGLDPNQKNVKRMPEGSWELGNKEGKESMTGLSSPSVVTTHGLAEFSPGQSQSCQDNKSGQTQTHRHGAFEHKVTFLPVQTQEAVPVICGHGHESSLSLYDLPLEVGGEEKGGKREGKGRGRDAVHWLPLGPCVREITGVWSQERCH